MKGVDMIVGLDFGLSPMEEVIGAAPTSSGWKPDVLAGKLYLHIGRFSGLLSRPIR